MSDLFGRSYTGPDERFLGCDPDGMVFACTYLYEGGSTTYRTGGSAEDGYQVVEISQSAD